MKLFIINGPNINMLGIREPELYGRETYPDLVKKIAYWADKLGIEAEVFQSNHEGDIIDKIQEAYGQADGIVINPGGYTHTSIAIADALKAVALPAAEVHITDINKRENYRSVSFVKEACLKSVIGHGTDGYFEAMQFLTESIK